MKIINERRVYEYVSGRFCKIEKHLVNKIVFIELSYVFSPYFPDFYEDVNENVVNDDKRC